MRSSGPKLRSPTQSTGARTKHRSGVSRMAKVWTSIIEWTVAMALVLGGVSFLYWQFAQGACTYERIRSSPSRDGRYIADVTFRDCGRDLGFSYLVSLRRSSVEQGQGSPREVIVAAYLNDLDGDPFWEGDSLVIPYAHSAPNLRRAQWRDLRVETRNFAHAKPPPVR